jgi:hypothetical protein
MSFQLSDVLKAIGPTASIIFAAWIFLSFLEARYDAAVDRYRELIAAYRKGEGEGDRAETAKRQIEVYARRCTIMTHAVTLGLVAAILFLAVLITGALDVVIPHNPAIAVVGTTAGVGGFILVIVAAALVIVDNVGTPGQLREELKDVPEVSQSAAGSTRLAR